jgi:nitroreductase
VLKFLKKTAKQMLAVPAVRRTYEAATRTVLEVVGGTRIGATVYSVPGFLTFNREQYAVLSGRRAYYKNLSAPRITHVELRRNVHRLEKALTMEPRRPVFARDYILETIDFYANALNGSSGKDGIDPAELTWAHHVLDAYFDTVDHSEPKVERARNAYEALPAPSTIDIDRHLTPYAHADVTHSDVTYDQLLALARQRRSTRWYQDRPVPHELIDNALVVGREAPTACNREPFYFRVFDDPEKIHTLTSIVQGTDGYGHQIPTLIVVTGRFDSYFSPRDRHAPYIDASLAAMQFMLALETQGLSSSVVNWPDFEPLELRMQKTLGLKPYERVLFLISVGYPRDDGAVPSSVKKSLPALRSYNAPTK